MRLVCSLLFLTAGLGLAAETEDRLTRSVPAGPGGKLTLDAEWGSVDVQPGSGQEVKVEVYRTVDAPSEAETKRILADFALDVTPSGNDVTVRGRFRDGWKPRSQVSKPQNCRDNLCLEYGRYLRKFEYRVTVPARYSVTLATRGGSIAVGDLQGSADATTSGGSLRFGSLTGTVRGATSGGSISLAGGSSTADLRTSGGSIVVGDVTGDVVANTSGGSIQIGKVTGRVRAETSGGSIAVKETSGTLHATTSGGNVTALMLAQPQGDSTLTTSGGTIQLAMAESLAVNLDASTSGGTVQTDLPVTVNGKLSKHSMKAALNGGGPRVELRSSGGSVHVKRAAAR